MEKLFLKRFEGCPQPFYLSGIRYVSTDGKSEFQFLSSDGRLAQLNFLSSNASLWIRDEMKENGTLVQVDHRNTSTGVKFTRVMKCWRIPKDKVEEDKCYTSEIMVTLKCYI